MNKPFEITFREIISALKNNEKPLDVRYLYRLSDLENEELKEFEEVWQNISDGRKESLMEDIKLIGEEDNLLSFLGICMLAIQDKNASVRLHGINILSKYDHLNPVPHFINIAEKDEDVAVRVAAINALSQYVLFGELDEIQKEIQEKIEELLFHLYQTDPEVSVRRSALEALGYSCRPEVKPLIEEAYASEDKEWVASALFAIARSSDSSWAPKVLEMLDNIHPVIRCEAARAAGELEMRETVPQLIQLIDDPDQQTRENSIWSLSQIGSDGIEIIIDKLYDEAEDEQEIKFLENAMDNLEFTQETQSLSLLDFSEDELDDFDDYDDYDDYDDLELSSEDDEDW